MSGQPLTIRPLEASDEAAWRRLWGLYQRFYAVDLSEEVHRSTWARLLDPAEPVNGALALIDGAPVGLVHYIWHRTCWDIADSCYLQDLYVEEGTRGAGVGAALIAYVRGQADARGVAVVHWLTHEDNHRARRLYDHVARRSGFIQYRRS
ncbi:GNAT family N-acetyltransferase [Sandarakinorhabdus rubra]|uniref:GNAT family N-acetyltransferase n=1 Tax=Sandarakinorhabdus rubra TaxID=2672568 RepID=UPI0013D92068|nr:GNAT family N-acetyltransferase [Sandarakinorhabdus rubra]